MGSRGMIDSIKFNAQQKSKRKKLYDRENRLISSKFGKFEDHTSMKSHAFADFQKDLYFKRKKAFRKKIVLYVITIVLTLLTVLSIPYLIAGLLRT